MKKWFVITRYSRDFVNWCRSNGVQPRDALWVGHPDKLRGCIVKEDQVVRCGWKPDLIKEIDEYLQVCMSYYKEPTP